VIDWAKADTSDLYRFGKWLYWAEEWATFKAMTSESTKQLDLRSAWKSETMSLLQEQDKVREDLNARKCPYTSRGPSL
jgi:hypothetical protein